MGVARADDESEMGLIHHQEEEELKADHSVINFKICSPSTNLLSLELEQHKAMWEWEPSLITTTTTDEPFSWLYSDATLVPQHSATLPQLSSFPHKRPHSGETSTTQTSKKQCTTQSKLQQNKSSSSTNYTELPSIDPQSLAAKNRRERISERLKILQELVPNGSKVDMVTMLEKAINYVKFLQLQAMVLETDEFWPVQGGKAPDISQVKEAIDAILSSQRDSRNSCSSSKS